MHLEVLQSPKSVIVIHRGLLVSRVVLRCRYGGDSHLTLEIARQRAVTEAYRLSLLGYGDVRLGRKRFADRYAELDVLWDDLQARRQSAGLERLAS